MGRRGGLFVKADCLEDFLPKSQRLGTGTTTAGRLQLVALIASAAIAATAVVTIAASTSIAASVSVATTTSAAIAVSVPVAIIVAVSTALPAAAVISILVLFRHCLVSVRLFEPGRPPQDKQGKDFSDESPLAP